MTVFDTSRLLQQVKLKAALPTGRFEDEEILSLASDVLISEIAPMIVANREEYYVKKATYAVVGGQAEYDIPYRALGAALREVKLIDGSTVKDISRIDPEDVRTTSAGAVQSFYLEGDKIVLYPTPEATSGSLIVSYFIRPSVLVPTTSCARITGVNGQTLSLVPPSTWSTSDDFDIVRGQSGFSLKGFDLEASAVNAGDIVFSTSVPTDAQIGDYVTLAGESCFPYIPADAHQFLVQLTVVACLEAMGDQTNLQIAIGRANMLKKALQDVLSTRIQGAPRRFSTTLI